MSTPDARTEYERRIGSWNEAIARGERTHLLISNIRLVLFAAGALVAWLAFVRTAVAPSALLLPGGAFAVLMVVHARVLNARDRAIRARQYYERGVARLEGRWAGQGAPGDRFLDGHPYARDLDLFGHGSLFQLLNTARTEIGQETLSDWLRAPSLTDDVRARQECVEELKRRLDFRETLAVVAAEAHVSRTGALERWAETEPVGFGSGHAWLFAGCAGITAALLIAGALGIVDGISIWGWLAVTTVVALAFRARVWRVIRGVDAAAHDLGLLEDLLAVLERTTFQSARLAALRGRLDGGDRPSVTLRRLRRCIAARDALRNEFVRPFGLLLLVRSQAAVAIDRWHQAHRRTLGEWLIAVGEFEALASLGTYAHENAADPFPRIGDGGPLFDAGGLAHPLLAPGIAVRNDVILGGDGPRVLIVSGSNMSGKSTLLRAVGINVVLALAGGPVRASRLTLSPLAIGATLRVEDSLQEGHSRFYTEILRIRDIVASTTGKLPVLFLLDEILHGTNSHDRRIGAQAIVAALVRSGAIGLVTTHDLALAELPATLGDAAKNVHFEDRIEDGRMVFDFRMREGVVERSNALELMRAVGLDV